MRLKRDTYTGAFHHIMNRGRQQQLIFIDQPDMEVFENLLKEGRKRFAVELHAYCLMGNHFQLLLENHDEMSRFMHWVCVQYVTHFNETHGFDGPLFKDRFKSLIVDSDRYLTTLVGLKQEGMNL